jgi:tripeptide aminopeptidase
VTRSERRAPRRRRRPARRPTRGDALEASHLEARLRERLRAITEVPAPPFGEAQRSAFVAAAWRAVGLPVEVDELGDVVAELPGGEGPRVLLAAHLDTVFPAGTDVQVRELDAGRWAAPGISDDAAGLAVLSVLAEEVVAGRGGRRPRLTWRPRSARRASATCAARAGSSPTGAATSTCSWRSTVLGQVVSAAVGSRRIEARFLAAGGHAWGDRGAPSAVHAMGDAIHALIRIELPPEPRWSLNVGLAGGGLVDQRHRGARQPDGRSPQRRPDVLELLVGRVEQRLRSVGRRHRVEVDLVGVGDRRRGAARTRPCWPPPARRCGGSGSSRASPQQHRRQRGRGGGDPRHRLRRGARRRRPPHQRVGRSRLAGDRPARAQHLLAELARR